MDARPEYRACPACDSDAASRLAIYSPDPWIVACCDGCGFVFLRNPPEYEALVEDFAWEKTSAEKTAKGGSTWLSGANRAIRRNFGYRGRTRAEKLVAIFGSGKVLDIGCGTGERLQPPLVPFGIELSAELHRQADARMRERGGHCLHAPGAEGIRQFEAEMFDGILMHSYLEHEVNVMQVLTGAALALKPAGKIFVRVPNFGSLNRRVIGTSWCGFRYPDHVNYFTLASLRNVAARAGFTARLVNRMSLWVDDNIQVLLTKDAVHRER